MSSNKYVNLSLYFTLPPEKSPTEAIAAVNRFIKEKLSMEYELLACENWNKKHPEVVRISNETAEIHDMDTAALELEEFIRKKFGVSLQGFWIEEVEFEPFRCEVHNGKVEDEALNWLGEYPNEIIAKVRRYAEQLLKEKHSENLASVEYPWSN